MPPLFHLDNFDHCMLYDSAALYCSLTFQLAPADPHNATHVWTTIRTVSSDPTNYRHDLLRHGVCVPTACPGAPAASGPRLHAHLEQCYRARYAPLGLTGRLTRLHCQTPATRYPITAAHYAFVAVLAAYLLVVAVASVREGIARYIKTPAEYAVMAASVRGRVLCAFAITRNWMRLKAVDTSNPEVDYFRPIQGIRFYNMFFVILTHAVMMNLGGPVSNPLYTETLAEKAITGVLSGGGLAMQTSFAMSTLLLTYGFFRKFEHRKDIPIKVMLLALVHRFVRLTPVMAFVWALHSTWLVHASNGPLWDELMGEDYRRCSGHGWSNLLYINNYVEKTKMCLPHTWYMACDTQFFIMTMILLKYIKPNEKRIYGVVAAILSINAVSTFLILYINNWEYVLRTVPESMYHFAVVDNPVWHVILSSNYANTTGMGAGMLLGYVLFKTRNMKLFTTKKQVILWWVLTCGLAGGLILIPGNITYAAWYQHNRLYSALFGAVSKILFLFGMGVGIVGFAHGVGWCALWTLNWGPMYYLGKITYAAYIVHLTFEKPYAAAKRHPTFLSDYAMFTQTVSDITLSYLAGLVLHLIFELPVSELLKLLPGPKSQKNLEQKSLMKEEKEKRK